MILKIQNLDLITAQCKSIATWAYPKQADLERVSLENVDIEGVELKKAKLEQCISKCRITLSKTICL